MSFSKKISVLTLFVTLILTILSILFPVWGLPVDGIINALPYSWGATSAVQVFYFWKAKNENRNKYAMRYVDKIADKYGIETAVRIAEVVLKD